MAGQVKSSLFMPMLIQGFKPKLLEQLTWRRLLRQSDICPYSRCTISMSCALVCGAGTFFRACKEPPGFSESLLYVHSAVVSIRAFPNKFAENAPVASANDTLYPSTFAPM